jgi:polyhydroxyalkanoate synthesis regulator phasin
MPRKKKEINDFQEYNKIKYLKIVNTPIVEVPQNMLYINNQGDKKVIHTLTKKGRITTRDKKPIVNFISNSDEPNIYNQDFYARNKGDTLENIARLRSSDLGHGLNTSIKIQDKTDSIKRLENKLKKTTNERQKKILEKKIRTLETERSHYGSYKWPGGHPKMYIMTDDNKIKSKTANMMHDDFFDFI